MKFSHETGTLGNMAYVVVDVVLTLFKVVLPVNNFICFLFINKKITFFESGFGFGLKKDFFLSKLSKN